MPFCKYIPLFVGLVALSVHCLAQDVSEDEIAVEAADWSLSDDSVASPSAWRVSNNLLLPSVARPDSNFLRLSSAGLSSEMLRFVDKMDSVLLLGKGRVSILHIGGSHVQADLYTDVIRHHVDSLNGGLMPPRGFVFPFAAAKTNNPLGYRTRYGGKWDKNRCSLKQFVPALGMGGIAISTQDTSSWFSIDLNRDSTGRWTTNRVHLLCRSTGGHLAPVFSAAVGDSLVRFLGVPEPTGYRYDLPVPVSYFHVGVCADSLWRASSGDTFVVTGVVPDNDDDGIVYHTIGVNGASVPSYLGCDLFEKELRLIRPDLVIMAIGINDATGKNFTDSLFCDNYASLIRQIRRVSPQCAFLFITNNDSSIKVSRRRRKVNPNGEVAQRAFYMMAEQWHGAVWDLFEIMGGLGSMGEWQKMGLAQRDRVHFSREGYNVVGELFYDAFLDFYLNVE